MVILVMGLPGSGKTTLAKALSKKLGWAHFNGDEERGKANDWDFSEYGRIVQAWRMRELSLSEENSICDFVCPTEDARKLFNPDITVFMDTIKTSKYKDTNQLFERPECDYRVKTKQADMWAEIISEEIETNNG